MRPRGGFTMIEVLAAMLMLAILVPVIVEGLGIANRAAMLAERDAIALRLGENQLATLLVSTNDTASVSSGDFGADWPGYRWALTQANWTEDDMTEVTLEVTYEARGQTRRLILSTLSDETTQ